MWVQEKIIWTDLEVFLKLKFIGTLFRWAAYGSFNGKYLGLMKLSIGNNFKKFDGIPDGISVLLTMFQFDVSIPSPGYQRGYKTRPTHVIPLFYLNVFNNVHVTYQKLASTSPVALLPLTLNAGPKVSISTTMSLSSWCVDGLWYNAWKINVNRLKKHSVCCPSLHQHTYSFWLTLHA